jgi:tetrahydromethanopterin S-methyltransferase subunit F
MSVIVEELSQKSRIQSVVEDIRRNVAKNGPFAREKNLGLRSHYVPRLLSG